MIDTTDLLQRFLSYVQIDTQSDAHSATTPSSAKQWTLIRKLETELRALGLSDVRVTEFGYVLATLPATSQKRVPRVAFLAHVDTADSCAGLAKPLVHRQYDGKPVVLPDDPAQVLSVETTPDLAEHIGQDLVTASGNSLLGGDDKAGIAIIMAAVRHLLLHPEILHGPLRVCFNPDEEIGRGMEKLRLEELDADVAYTLDAENLGEVDGETFSADKAIVTIHGVAAHPGMAKGVMVNALRIAAEFIAELPLEHSPECTEKREGFIHPLEITGTPELATICLLLRDFERDGLETLGRIVNNLVARLEDEEPRTQIDLQITPQYRNMRYWLEKDSRPVDYALAAVRRSGVAPRQEFIRGGTDGARLTERGLPTPNIFAGFHDVHSPREWVSLYEMEKAAETIVNLVQVWEERA